MFWNSADSNVNERLDELEDRVTTLEVRMTSVEDSIERAFVDLGRYKGRDHDEFVQIQGQLTTLTETLEALVANAENREGIQRAKALLRRARYHKTSVTRHLSAVA